MGKEGIFLVILGLSWWVSMANTKPEVRKVSTAIDDIAWVMERMIGTDSEESQGATKRSRVTSSVTAEDPKPKRAR